MSPNFISFFFPLARTRALLDPKPQDLAAACFASPHRCRRPELQRFAIKVLGLTCSSSGCERNWSTFNQVHTKRRNRLSTLRMNSLVYIMYNKRLKDKHQRKGTFTGGEDPLLCNDVPSDDEWFIDDAQDQETTAPPDLVEEDLEVDFFDGDRSKAQTDRPNTSRQSIKKGKRKMTEIEEEEEEWENVETTEDEAGERGLHYDDDSNEDPSSDEIADEF